MTGSLSGSRTTLYPMPLELRETQGAVSYWQLVAEKIRIVPVSIQIARSNIVRWREQGQSATHRLDEWEALLIKAVDNETGLRELIDVLLGADERSERLREFNPFAGILNREERRQASELCGFRH